jgi:hypothetical protein
MCIDKVSRDADKMGRQNPGIAIPGDSSAGNRGHKTMPRLLPRYLENSSRCSTDCALSLSLSLSLRCHYYRCRPPLANSHGGYGAHCERHSGDQIIFYDDRSSKASLVGRDSTRHNLWLRWHPRQQRISEERDLLFKA